MALSPIIFGEQERAFMAQENTYKHITVTADDDDEIVIHTGASRTTLREQEAELVYEDVESTDQPFGLEESEDYDEELEQWPEEVFEGEEEATADEWTDSQDEAFEQEAAEASSAAAREPQYRETTQEDLDSVGPRSTTQKAVIGCVVVFLIAFVIYYVFIM